jgi:hypothetical protein
MTLSITKLYTQSHCAKCRDLVIVVLNVSMLSVVMLDVAVPPMTVTRQKLQPIVSDGK